MSLERGWRNFARRTKIRGVEVDRRVAIFALSKAKLLSPVDKGLFRANWNLSINQANATVDKSKLFDGEPGDSVRSDELTEGQAALSGMVWGQEPILASGVPYGPFLEAGHSNFAPSGILGPTVELTRAAIGGIISGVVRSGL